MTFSPAELKALEQKQAQISAKREEFRKGLPHLYGWDWYDWAWNFFQSRNKMNLLVAANQVSKSSTQIRKCIEWAGNPKLWAELWPKNPMPKQFWYLYPDRETTHQEYETKWCDFLPAFAFKDHPTYGWHPTFGDRRKIAAIEFKSGVRVLFKTYAQDVSNLQSGSCHAIFADEELPVDLYSELNARLFGVDGYFHMVFTATLNQDFWKLAMEGEGEVEKFPEAFKQQVSMYDCQTYKSGKPGAFTEERIERIKASCKSETEILRRVNGRFVTEIGRKYPQFDAARHFKKPFAIPGDWRKYAAVDIGGGGGGGTDGHAPAVAFVAVRPDNRLGVVYKGWRGDDGQFWSAGDVLTKFQELRGADLLTAQRYDQHSKDFIIIATRQGEPFLSSDKSHERGESIINTLFKNDMLYIFQDDQLEKLGGELTSLMRHTPKRQAKDDFCDAMRYCVVDIPWDWGALKGDKTDEERAMEEARPYTDEERVEQEITERRGEFVEEGKVPEGWAELERELDEWQEIAGGG